MSKIDLSKLSKEYREYFNDEMVKFPELEEMLFLYYSKLQEIDYLEYDLKNLFFVERYKDELNKDIEGLWFKINGCRLEAEEIRRFIDKKKYERL